MTLDHYQDINGIYGARQIRADMTDVNGNETNRWQLIWSVGCSQLCTSRETAVSYPSLSESGYDGTPCYSINVQSNMTVFGFVGDKSAVGYGGNGGGNGNYALRSDSQLWQNLRPTVEPLPYDITGAPRGMLDPPGAYASGNPNYGAAILGF
jgi:hypothetical protein